MRKQSGFTLIELLVVIIILGALMAIAVPNYLSYVPRARLRNAARDLYSELQLAKMAAIKVNSNCNVTYALPGTITITYTVSGAVNTRTVTLADYGAGVSFVVPPGGSVPYDTANIGFNSRGLRDVPAAGNAYAYLSNDGTTGYYRIGPLISGVVQLNKLVGGVWE